MILADKPSTRVFLPLERFEKIKYVRAIVVEHAAV